jgi:hypothetical protein
LLFFSTIESIPLKIPQLSGSIPYLPTIFISP